VIKIAVLTEAMARVKEGTVDLAERWDLSEAKKADGSGTLLMLDPGLNPTWNDLATLMIGPSDNTATNAWIDRLESTRSTRACARSGSPASPCSARSRASRRETTSRRPGRASGSASSPRARSATG
jgi:beta-lactamase class A